MQLFLPTRPNIPLRVSDWPCPICYCKCIFMQTNIWEPLQPDSITLCSLPQTPELPRPLEPPLSESSSQTTLCRVVDYVEKHKKEKVMEVARVQSLYRRKFLETPSSSPPRSCCNCMTKQVFSRGLCRGQIRSAKLLAMMTKFQHFPLNPSNSQ